jgi:hypothetical protein
LRFTICDLLWLTAVVSLGDDPMYHELDATHRAVFALQLPTDRRSLRGLTGNITHVVVDPAKGKLAGFVALERFVEIVAAGKVV